MFAEERYLRIVEQVNEKGKVTVAELSRHLDVSPVTIRRDLEKLEEKRLLIRTHGGAMSLEGDVMGVAEEKSFSEKEAAYREEKVRIAAAAAGMVQEGESILLTPGTTNMLLAKSLSGIRNLKLVTNAVNIAVHVGAQSQAEVILIGGMLRSKSQALVGPLTEEGLKHIRVDKLFMGVDGIDLKHGLTTPNLSEAMVNRQMMDMAKEIIVVADRSKFGRVTFAHIAPLNKVSAVITDSKLSRHTVQALREQGIRVVTV